MRFTFVTIRPVYSKFVLPSRKSLEIIINKKKKKNSINYVKLIDYCFKDPSCMA